MCLLLHQITDGRHAGRDWSKIFLGKPCIQYSYSCYGNGHNKWHLYTIKSHVAQLDLGHFEAIGYLQLCHIPWWCGGTHCPEDQRHQNGLVSWGCG